VPNDVQQWVETELNDVGRPPRPAASAATSWSTSGGGWLITACVMPESFHASAFVRQKPMPCANMTLQRTHLPRVALVPMKEQLPHP
jgi:hypothetical protein